MCETISMYRQYCNSYSQLAWQLLLTFLGIQHKIMTLYQFLQYSSCFEFALLLKDEIKTKPNKICFTLYLNDKFLAHPCSQGELLRSLIACRPSVGRLLTLYSAYYSSETTYGIQTCSHKSSHMYWSWSRDGHK